MTFFHHSVAAARSSSQSVGSAETVVNTYQYLQAQMLRRKPRALSQRNLAVAQFVMRELREMVIAESEGQPDHVDYGEQLMNRVKTSPDETSENEWTEQQRRPWRMLMGRWNQ